MEPSVDSKAPMHNMYTGLRPTEHALSSPAVLRQRLHALALRQALNSVRFFQVEERKPLRGPCFTDYTEAGLRSKGLQIPQCGAGKLVLYPDEGDTLTSLRVAAGQPGGGEMPAKGSHRRQHNRLPGTPPSCKSVRLP